MKRHFYNIVLILFILSVFFYQILAKEKSFISPYGDGYHQTYPWLTALVNSVQKGQLSLWSFPTLGGQSQVGELQPGSFYLLHYIFALLVKEANIYNINLYILTHYFILALGSYYLAIVIGLKNISAILLSLFISLWGNIAHRSLAQANLFFGLSYFPLVLAIYFYCIVKLSKIKLLKYSIILGFSLSLSFLAGHTHNLVNIIVALLFVSLFYWKQWKKIFLIGAFAIPTFLLFSLPQILATNEYLKLSYKWYGEGFTQYPHIVPYTEYIKYKLSFQDLLNGNFSIEGNSLYIPIVFFIFIVFRFIFIRHKSIIRPKIKYELIFFIFILFSFLQVFLADSLWGYILYKIPVINNIRVASRWLFMYTIGFFVLSIISLDYIIDYIQEKKNYKLYFIISFIIFVLTVLLSYPQIILNRLFKYEDYNINTKCQYGIDNFTKNKPYRLYVSHAIVKHESNDFNFNYGDISSILTVNTFRSSRTIDFHNYFDWNFSGNALDLLSVKYYFSPDKLNKEGITLIYENNCGYLYMNETAKPILYQENDNENVIDTFDFGGEKIIFKLNKNVSGRVIFTQRYYPGFWFRTKSEIGVVENYLGFSSFILNSETSEIEIIYKPWFLRKKILAIIIFTYLFLIGILFLLINKNYIYLE